MHELSSSHFFSGEVGLGSTGFGSGFTSGSGLIITFGYGNISSILFLQSSQATNFVHGLYSGILLPSQVYDISLLRFDFHKSRQCVHSEL